VSRPSRRSPIYVLGDGISFPPPELANEDGLLAIGGDLRPERLLAAYRQGIFPWPHEGLPLLWFSPDPRFVLTPRQLHVPRRLERSIRQGRFEVRFDTSFRAVVRSCANVVRRLDTGTWITPEIIAAYAHLHELGFAHCSEVWRDGRLVGGLYGVAIGRMFCGESMFGRESEASKVALVVMARRLVDLDYAMFDAQLPVRHLVRYGFREVPREEYLRDLEAAVSNPACPERW